MAASTAGMLVLRNRGDGKTRSETFTMTPANDEYATFAANGQTHLLVAPQGEDIVDLQFNADGVTTCSQALFKLDGQDIRNRYLMALFASDNAMPTRLVSPIQCSGNKQLQLQFKT